MFVYAQVKTVLFVVLGVGCRSAVDPGTLPPTRQVGARFRLGLSVSEPPLVVGRFYCEGRGGYYDATNKA